MRSIVIIAVLACAATSVNAREDRYGPSPDRRSGPLSAANGYGGPVLSWASKQNVSAPSPVQAPQPLNRPRLPTYTQATPPVEQSSQALPRNSYGAASPVPSAPVADAPQPAQVATAPVMGPNMVRTYSVGRLYGQQPDPLAPLQPNGMVFIAPSEEPPRAKDEPPRHGSAEWLAQAPRDADETTTGEDAKDNGL